MRQLMLKLWKDDAGALIATEWVFVATILVLGAITGLVAVRQAVISELTEFANAVLALSQSYSFTGQSNCESSTAGSAASDQVNLIQMSSFSTTPTDIHQDPCD
jgi:Flp pilus assembly pilin Flp